MPAETPNLTPNQILDARGMSCPLPLLKAKQALNRMGSGEILHVLATDAGSQRDFQRFCELSGHSLLATSCPGLEFHYWLRRE